MAITSNPNNVTKRIDVGRRLTFGEMDQNFEQLKLVINDASQIELQLADKVSKIVYDAKMASIDGIILDIQTELVGKVSQESLDLIIHRLQIVEGQIQDIIEGGGTGGSSVTVSDTPPTDAVSGDEG